MKKGMETNLTLSTMPLSVSMTLLKHSMDATMICRHNDNNNENMLLIVAATAGLKTKIVIDYVMCWLCMSDLIHYISFDENHDYILTTFCIVTLDID